MTTPNSADSQEELPEQDELGYYLINGYRIGFCNECGQEADADDPHPDCPDGEVVGYDEGEARR